MSHSVLITGGARSGKSDYACEQATQCGKRILFVATCVPRDDEMRAKVKYHRAQRPGTWHTVERFREVAGVLKQNYDAAVVDCLTLLVSQMLVDGMTESDVLAEVGEIFDASAYPLFVVTNEVGWGIIPDHALARRFRELAGRVNCLSAERADEVVLMVSGIPVKIK